LLSAPALLRWLLVGRIALAATTLVQVALARAESPGFATAALVVVGLALAVTGYGAYFSLARRQRPGLALVQVQAVMDLLLVTGLVHFAGAYESGWVALYVLVIAVYGLVMPIRSGLVTVVLGATLFLADAYFGHRGSSVQPGLWGQVAVFTVVFLVVAVLGQRLRAAAVEQTQLETELERVRLEADEILRHIRSGVLTVDGRGCLAYINPTAEQLLGIGAGALGQPVLEDLGRRAPELHAALVAGIRQGRRVPRAEGRVVRPDGRGFPIGLSTATFERGNEAVPSVAAIFTDISDLRSLQELHVRAQRSEAVATLSASLAHEIRNPLASIRSAVEQLARSSGADADERVLGDLILRESDRLNRLLGEFLDFSRVRVDQFRVVNLLAVAQDAVRMVTEHPDRGPGIEVSAAGEPLLIRGDEDLLHRIVWNLLLNAVQAIKGSGRVAVTVDAPPAAELARLTGFEQAVRLRVVDTGPGIDPEVRDRLFLPFVSSRPGGSGLGLAIVERAVEAHRGIVLVDSAPGQGTTFTILLHAKGPTEEAA
jgi:two-component system sensor histidine kinase PilS (NtrC family)